MLPRGVGGARAAGRTERAMWRATVLRRRGTRGPPAHGAHSAACPARPGDGVLAALSGLLLFSAPCPHRGVRGQQATDRGGDGLGRTDPGHVTTGDGDEACARRDGGGRPPDVLAAEGIPVAPHGQQRQVEAAQLRLCDRHPGPLSRDRRPAVLAVTLPRTCDELVTERGWDTDRYREQMTRMVTRALRDRP